MKKLAAAVIFIAVPAFALDAGDCARLSALYEIRSLMLKRYTSSYDVDKAIDRRLEDLRDPLPGGGYRWVKWVRRDSDAPVDKKVHKLRGGSTSDRFESNSDHVFAVRVVVPSKKSLFSSNNPVSVGTVTINYTVDGRQRTRTERIDTTMSPDTSRTIDLGTIADHVEVALEAGSNSEAVVETHYRQASAEDDPANPAYATVQSLKRLRANTDARTVDAEIASVERSMFKDADPLPLLQIVEDLRKADELMRSSKQDDKDKGEKLLKETLRRLR